MINQTDYQPATIKVTTFGDMGAIFDATKLFGTTSCYESPCDCTVPDSFVRNIGHQLEYSSSPLWPWTSSTRIIKIHGGPSLPDVFPIRGLRNMIRADKYLTYMYGFYPTG